MLQEPLLDPSKIFFPPLHIKLRLIKQFTEALDKEEACFKYLSDHFPGLSNAKIKAGIFDYPQIRKIFRDPNFIPIMNKTEKLLWLSFQSIAENFLGNHKSQEYEQIVSYLFDNCERLGCLMSVKLHFLHIHLQYFPENLGDYSEEQGE